MSGRKASKPSGSKARITSSNVNTQNGPNIILPMVPSRNPSLTSSSLAVKSARGRRARRSIAEDPQTAAEAKAPSPPPMVEAEGKPKKFDKYYISEVQDHFSFFDYDLDGELNSDELTRLLQTLGYNPSEAEVARLMQKHDSDRKGLVNFEGFLTMLPSVKNTEDTYADLMEAFRYFDKEGRGKIKSGKLKNILTTHGEKLSDDDAMEVVKFALGGDVEGMIDYRDFIDILLENSRTRYF